MFTDRAWDDSDYNPSSNSKPIGLGGAILVIGDGASAILNSVIIDGSFCGSGSASHYCANGGGAVAVLFGARLDLVESVLLNHQVGFRGGALFVLASNSTDDETTVQISETSFVNNQANTVGATETFVAGGAITVAGKCPRVSLTNDNVFTGNMMDAEGDASTSSAVSKAIVQLSTSAPKTIAIDTDCSESPGKNNGATILFDNVCSVGKYRGALSKEYSGDWSGCPFSCPATKTTTAATVKWQYEYADQPSNQDLTYTLTHPGSQDQGKLGESVSMFGDTAVVSHAADGSLHIYERNRDADWVHSKITGIFAHSANKIGTYEVSVSSRYIFAAQLDVNKVKIFERHPTNGWPDSGDEAARKVGETSQPHSTFPGFGCALANSDNFAIIAACEKRFAYIFYRVPDENIPCPAADVGTGKCRDGTWATKMPYWSDNTVFPIGGAYVENCLADPSNSRSAFSLAINDDFAILSNQGGSAVSGSQYVTCIFAHQAATNNRWELVVSDTPTAQHGSPWSTLHGSVAITKGDNNNNLIVISGGKPNADDSIYPGQEFVTVLKCERDTREFVKVGNGGCSCNPDRAYDPLSEGSATGAYNRLVFLNDLHDEVAFSLCMTTEHCTGVNKKPFGKFDMIMGGGDYCPDTRFMASLGCIDENSNPIEKRDICAEIKSDFCLDNGGCKVNGVCPASHAEIGRFCRPCYQAKPGSCGFAVGGPAGGDSRAATAGCCQKTAHTSPNFASTIQDNVCWKLVGKKASCDATPALQFTNEDIGCGDGFGFKEGRKKTVDIAPDGSLVVSCLGQFVFALPRKTTEWVKRDETATSSANNWIPVNMMEELVVDMDVYRAGAGITTMNSYHSDYNKGKFSQGQVVGIFLSVSYTPHLFISSFFCVFFFFLNHFVSSFALLFSQERKRLQYHTLLQQVG